MDSRYVGQWWVPDAASSRVAGELTITPGQPALLELQEPLSDGLPTSTLDVVLGSSTHGEVLTLADVGSLGISRASTRKLDHEVMRETMSPRAIFVGAHLPGPEDRLFSEAIIDLTDLMGWAGPTGLREDFGVGSADVTISVEPPPVHSCDLPQGRVQVTHGWGTAGDGVRTRSLDTSVAFLVTTTHPRDLSEWISLFVGPLRNLLTFAAQRPNEVTELRVKTLRYDATHGTWVEVWYPRGHSDREPALYGFDFLVDLPGLGDDFERFVKRWFELHEKLGTVIPLFLGPRYRPDTFMDNHFLNAAGATEAYHRILYRNEVLPKAEHKIRLATAIDSAPEAHRPWLRETLAHSNEPTFRDRLRELHARSFNVVAGVVGTADDFAGPVVKLRNALTHRGKGTPKATPPGIDMFRLTQITRFVLESCLLLDLGLDEMAVVDATRRSLAFRWIEELEMRERMRTV